MKNRHITDLVKPFKRQMWITLVLFILGTAIEFGGPFYARTFLAGQLLQSVMLIVLSILLSGLISSLIIVYQHKKEIKLKSRLSRDLCGDLMNMTYPALISKESSFMYEKISMVVDDIAAFYLEALPQFIVSLICIGLCFLITIWIDWRITVVFFLMMAVQTLGYKELNRKLSIQSSELQTASASKFSSIISLLGNMDYIKQMPDHRPVQDIIESREQSQHAVEARINIFAGCMSTLFDTLLLVLSNAVYIYVPIALTQNLIQVQDSILLILVNSLFIPAAKRVIGSNIRFASVTAGIKFLTEEIMPFVEDSEENRENLSTIDRIDARLSSLTVSGKSILGSGEFHIQSGDIVKVQGQTGSGKSCLMKSLVCFFPAQELFINGTSLSRLTRKDIRTRICYVPQNPTVFSGTVLDNIMFGKQSPAFEKLMKGTIFEKYFTGDIGLDKMIIENGANLSGGEKQKIALARALTDKWDVLILDEATSAMDQTTERELLEFFVRFCRENHKILFVISHGNAIDPYCSQILTVQDGKVLAEPRL